MMKNIRKITDTFVVLLFSSLIILVFTQVVSRFVFHSGIAWIDESSRYTFVWLIYLGGTITVRKGINITFDLILDAFHGKLWKIVFTIVTLVCVAFLALVFILGLIICKVNLTQSSSLLHINMGFVMFAIPLGALLMIFEQIGFYINKLKQYQLCQKGE